MFVKLKNNNWHQVEPVAGEPTKCRIAEINFAGTWVELAKISSLEIPSDLDILEMLYDKIVKTPAGTWAEKDGFCVNGFPAWPLALGITKPYPIELFNGVNNVINIY